MYREYPPPLPLAPYVECFWTKRLDVSRTRVRQRVLPDGCMDILFYLDADRRPEGLVVGTMTRALLVDEPAGDRIVAVRFRPGAAIAFLATPAHELTDRNVALAEVWRDTDWLCDQLRTAASPTACVAELERELLLRLAKGGARPLDPLIDAAVGALRRVQDEPPRIGELARTLGVSRQHLAQKFKVHVGIGPKEFERVVRMTRLTERLLAPGRPKTTAELAYDLGYYDQAHMIHEFKALTGLTPREYTADVRDSIFPIQGPEADAHSRA